MKSSDGDRLTDADPEFAKLVSALRSRGPSNEALARTLVAVDSAATGAPAARFAPRTGKVAVVLGAGVVALVLAGAAAYDWSRGPAGAPATTAKGAAAPAREEAAPANVPTASVRVDDLPPAPIPVEPASPPGPQTKAAGTPKPAASITRPAPGSAPAGDDFRDELALVERVRKQLSSGDDEACLRSIDQYSRRFHDGAFVQEVEVMRVEALAASGDRERARAFGGKFLSEHPTSPYAGRVRSVLEKLK